MQPNNDSTDNGADKPNQPPTNASVGQDSGFVLRKHTVITPLPSSEAEAAPIAPQPLPQEMAAVQPFTPDHVAPQPPFIPPAPDYRAPQPVSEPVAPIDPQSMATAPQSAPQSQPVYGPSQPPVYSSHEPVAAAQAVVDGGLISPLYPGKDVKGKKSKTFIIVVIAAVAAVLILGVVGFAIWQKIQNSPDAVFKAALANSLSSPLIQEQLSTAVGNDTLKLNDTNTSQPIVDESLYLKSQNMTMEVYGDNQNGYVKYTLPKTGVAQMDNIIGKWIGIKSNGKIDPSVDASFSALTDPYLVILGHWITGNFNSNQNTMIVNYALDHKVYSYDSSKVTSGTLNGKSVYIYNVSLDSSTLKDYNQMVGNMLGLSSAKVNSELTYIGLDSIKSATMYVYKDSKQLAEVKAKDSVNGVSQADYQFGSSVQLPAQPKADITYAQFQSALNGGM